MSNLTEIASAFKIVSDSFDLFRLKPNDSDIQRINDIIVVTPLSVTLTGTNSGTADGDFFSDAVYKSNNGGIASNFMHASREDYGPAIARLGKEDRISKMRGMEHVCNAVTDNKNRICAVEVGTCNLIMANVEKT